MLMCGRRADGEEGEAARWWEEGSTDSESELSSEEGEWEGESGGECGERTESRHAKWTRAFRRAAEELVVRDGEVEVWIGGEEGKKAAVRALVWEEKDDEREKIWEEMKVEGVKEFEVLFRGAPLSPVFLSAVLAYLVPRLENNTSAGRILEMEAEFRVVFVEELVRLHRMKGSWLCKRWFGSLFDELDVESSILWGCECKVCIKMFPEGRKLKAVRKGLDAFGGKLPGEVVDEFRGEFAKMKARQYRNLVSAHASNKVELLRGSSLFGGWGEDRFVKAIKRVDSVWAKMTTEEERGGREETAGCSDSQREISVEAVVELCLVVGNHLQVGKEGEIDFAVVKERMRGDVGLGNKTESELRELVGKLIGDNQPGRSGKQLDGIDFWENVPVSADFKEWMRKFDLQGGYEYVNVGELSSMDRSLVSNELVRLHQEFGTSQCLSWFGNMLKSVDIEVMILQCCHCESCLFHKPELGNLSVRYSSGEQVPVEFIKFKALQIHAVLVAHLAGDTSGILDNTLFKGLSWLDVEYLLRKVHNELFHSCPVCTSVSLSWVDRSDGLESFINLYKVVECRAQELENSVHVNISRVVQHMKLRGKGHFPTDIENPRLVFAKYFQTALGREALQGRNSIMNELQPSRQQRQYMRKYCNGAPISEKFGDWLAHWLCTQTNYGESENNGRLLELCGADQITVVSEMVRLHRQYGTHRCLRWFGSLFTQFDIESCIFWGCRCEKCAKAFHDGEKFDMFRDKFHAKGLAISKLVLRAFFVALVRFKAQQLQALLVAHRTRDLGLLQSDPLFAEWEAKGEFEAAVQQAHKPEKCYVCLNEEPETQLSVVRKHLDLQMHKNIFRLFNKILETHIVSSDMVTTEEMERLGPVYFPTPMKSIHNFLWTKFGFRKRARSTQASQKVVQSLIGNNPIWFPFVEWVRNNLMPLFHRSNGGSVVRVLKLDAAIRTKLVNVLVQLHQEYGSWKCFECFQGILARADIEVSIYWGCRCETCVSSFPEIRRFDAVRDEADKNESLIPADITSEFRVAFLKLKCAQSYQLLCAHEANDLDRLKHCPLFKGWELDSYFVALDSIHDFTQCDICSNPVTCGSGPLDMDMNNRGLKSYINLYRTISNHPQLSVKMGLNSYTRIRDKMVELGKHLFPRRFRTKEVDLFSIIQLNRGWRHDFGSRDTPATQKVEFAASLQEIFSEIHALLKTDRSILELEGGMRERICDEIVRIHKEHGTIACIRHFEPVLPSQEIAIAIAWSCSCTNCWNSFPENRTFDNIREYCISKRKTLPRLVCKLFVVAYVRFEARRKYELLVAHQTNSMEDLRRSNMFIGWEAGDFDEALSVSHEKEYCHICFSHLDLVVSEKVDGLQTYINTYFVNAQIHEGALPMRMFHHVVQQHGLKYFPTELVSAHSRNVSKFPARSFRTNAIGFYYSIESVRKVDFRDWCSGRPPFSQSFEEWFEIFILERARNPQSRKAILRLPGRDRVILVKELVRLHCEYSRGHCFQWFGTVFSSLEIAMAILWGCDCNACFQLLPQCRDFKAIRKECDLKEIIVPERVVQDFNTSFNVVASRQWLEILLAHQRGGIENLVSNKLFEGWNPTAFEEALYKLHDSQTCEICSVRANEAVANSLLVLVQQNDLHAYLNLYSLISSMDTKHGCDSGWLESLEKRVHFFGKEKFPVELSTTGVVNGMKNRFRIWSGAKSEAVWRSIKETTEIDLETLCNGAPLSQRFSNWLISRLQSSAEPPRVLIYLKTTDRKLVSRELVSLHKEYGTQECIFWFKSLFSPAEIEKTILNNCRCDECAEVLSCIEKNCINMKRPIRNLMTYVSAKACQWKELLVTHMKRDSNSEPKYSQGFSVADTVQLYDAHSVADCKFCNMVSDEKEDACLVKVTSCNDVNSFMNLYLFVATHLKLSHDSPIDLNHLQSKMIENGIEHFPACFAEGFEVSFRKRFRLSPADDSGMTWKELRTRQRAVSLEMLLGGGCDQLSIKFSKWFGEYLITSRDSDHILLLQDFEARLTIVNELVRLHQEHGTRRCVSWFKTLYGEAEIESTIMWGCRCENCVSCLPEILEFNKIKAELEVKHKFMPRLAFVRHQLAFTRFKARQMYDILSAHQDGELETLMVSNKKLFSGWQREDFEYALEQAHDREDCKVCRNLLNSGRKARSRSSGGEISSSSTGQMKRQKHSEKC